MQHRYFKPAFRKSNSSKSFWMCTSTALTLNTGEPQLPFYSYADDIGWSGRAASVTSSETQEVKLDQEFPRFHLCAGWSDWLL